MTLDVSIVSGAAPASDGFLQQVAGCLDHLRGYPAGDLGRCEQACGADLLLFGHGPLRGRRRSPGLSISSWKTRCCAASPSPCRPVMAARARVCQRRHQRAGYPSLPVVARGERNLPVAHQHGPARSSITTLVDNALSLDLDLVSTDRFRPEGSAGAVAVALVDGPLSTVAALTEAVWNRYVITNGQIGDAGLYEQLSGSGGVDVTQPFRNTRSISGLRRSACPTATLRPRPTGVSALGGGGMFYACCIISRATAVQRQCRNQLGHAMWASLPAQIDAVFHDQGLPNLGFYNDLLYQAAAVTPGAFNDVTLGNNVSSYSIAVLDDAERHLGPGDRALHRSHRARLPVGRRV